MGGIASKSESAKAVIYELKSFLACVCVCVRVCMYILRGLFSLLYFSEYEANMVIITKLVHHLLTVNLIFNCPLNQALCCLYFNFNVRELNRFPDEG